ncbi:MAG: helix-turn-helix domain-containing protein [Candidatus Nealsonbacteria bacterium]|nr:helix-turn-helix domain-containing protein [Candidatus Nealsonbacteria bacterium]
MQQDKPFKVRDKRKENRYYVDNEFLNGYAKYVGWQGQVVYHALCRHAKDGTCFPSIGHLAAELGISETSVKTGVKRLKELNIISARMRTRTSKGRGSNIYWLLDRTEWKPVSNWSNQKKEYRPLKSFPVKP